MHSIQGELEQHRDAHLFGTLSYERFLHDRLGVMDQTAITLCRENALPIRVFKLTEPGNILRVCRGEPIGTLVSDEPTGDVD